MRISDWSSDVCSSDLVTITAEDVGAYKPDLRHFAKAISAFGGLGVPVGRILHVAQSLRADVTPGNRLGLATVWVNRGGQLGLTGYGAEEAKPDLTVASIAELVARHRAEAEIGRAHVCTPVTHAH